MKKLFSTILVTTLTFSGLFMGSVNAEPKGDLLQDKVQLREKLQLKDGSCQISGDCLRTKLQLKDGSCLISGDFLRTKKQLKDGSCLTA